MRNVFRREKDRLRQLLAEGCLITGRISIFLIVFLLLDAKAIFAQHPFHEIRSRPVPDTGEICTLDPTDLNAFFYIGADPRIEAVMKQQASLFEVGYSTDLANPCSPAGWPQEAIEAFEYAMAIWSAHLHSTVPIRVQAIWRSIETEDGVTLGSAGPTRIVQIPGVGVPGTWYSVAQLTAMTGEPVREQLNDDLSFDIRVNINCSFGEWYFGRDASPSEGLIDFITVVLHEMGHGLGFIGSLAAKDEDESAFWGAGEPPVPFVFDRFVKDGSHNDMLNSSIYPNPSVALFQALTGRRGGLFLAGDEVRSTLAGGEEEGARLYTPQEYRRGSSYSHLDQETFSGSGNALMRPRIDRAFAIHTPGPVFCGLLRDTGWPLGEGCLIYLSPFASVKTDSDFLDFGVLPAGGQQDLRLFLENEFFADELLRIEAEMDGSGFELLTESEFTVPPGASVQMGVRFSPDEAGIRQSRLRLKHNAKNIPSPLWIELYGEALREQQVVQLDQSFPNPIVSSGSVPTLSYAIAKDSDVKLDLYTAEGRHVRSLVHERQTAGRYRLELDLSGLSSGVYIYRIVVNSSIESGKLLYFR